MPTYNFYDTKKKKHLVLDFESWKDAEAYEKANHHMNWLSSAVPVADPVRLGRQKPSEGFRDVLRNMKKRMGPKSTINTF